ncbi:hypothetical protein CDD83_261 [Cordyceps sp. RAO-2017]|nr:hypothetical protein CDD83_261 [Cordyceps sp. RAO-2017]
MERFKMERNVADDLKVTILADTNRDGKVDVTGNTDIVDKETWSENSGALFLANIVDTDRRCSRQIDDSTSTEEIDKCNDAADNELRNSKYLAPIKTIPNSNLSETATGSIIVLDESAAPKVRIFHKKGDGWTFVSPEYSLSAEDLKAGLELGIDARDVRRPGLWDGRATVQLTVKDGDRESKDSVALRVAPVLTHHHGQLAEQLITADGISDSDPSASYREQAPFAKDFMQTSDRIGMKEEARILHTNDTWVQDYFEPGYSSIPGPDGPIGLRIMIRPSKMDREAGRLAFQSLRSDTVGAVQHIGYGSDTDTLGNLETIPPYTLDGKSYPAGRIVMGLKDGKEPEIAPFLEAQETQGPIVRLDTNWLMVGHVDEFIQFLPSEKGWVMMADDPVAGLEIFTKAQKEGHGGTRAMSRSDRPTDIEGFCVPKQSIDLVLTIQNLASLQEYASRMIQKNIDIIKRETGITDDQIFRVPTLYSDGYFFDYCDAKGDGNAAQEAKVQGGRESQPTPSTAAEPDPVHAMFPAAINSVVLPDRQVLAADPWGPVIDGEDRFKAAVTAAYAKANYTVLYIDDWASQHIKDGGVHCGSNTIRRMGDKWWASASQNSTDLQ